MSGRFSADFARELLFVIAIFVISGFASWWLP